MAGVDHGARFGIGPQGVAAKQLGEYRVLGNRRVEIQYCQSGLARDYQPRCVDRLGQYVG